MWVDVTTLLGIAIDSNITCYFREKLKRKKKKEKKKKLFFLLYTPENQNDFPQSVVVVLQVM